MGKASPAIVAFNAGEWSPLLASRSDLEGYGASCQTLRNFIPTIQGPAIKRAGSMFVREVKDSADDTILIPFVRSRAIAYVIEFGDEYCRFYTNRGILLDGGNPYEIVSPYPKADLINGRGEYLLDWTQSGDILYITHKSGTYLPRTLSRTATDTFAFATFQPDEGPFLPINSGSTTLYASASTGSVTITASANTFTSDMVGALVRIEQEELIETRPWSADNSSYSLNEYIRSDGKEYQVTDATGDSGTVAPTHTTGTVRATSGGNEFRFVTANYGIARITTYTSATEVTATVLTTLPQTVVGSTNATTLWRLGAWSDDNGYPTTVGFYLERLVFGQGQRVDMSVSADFDSFALDEFGEVLATSAVSVEVQSAQTDDIVAFAPAATLLTLTEGAEYSIGPLTNADPFGPDNVSVILRGSFGSRPQKAITVSESTLHMNASGTKLREIVYDIESDGLVSRDMLVRSEHLGIESALTQMVRAEDPYEVIVARREDGAGLLFTYDRTQDVRGWARLTIGGSDAKIIALATIPSPDGDRDDVWMIAERTVDESTVKYVEYFSAEFRPGDDQDDAFYVDSGLTYSGSAASKISGLDHLEGETVEVLGDGAVLAPVTVSSGEITLPVTVETAQVGLGYSAEIITARLEAGAEDGTAQGKKKRISDCIVRVLNARGGSAGPSPGDLTRVRDLNDRIPSTPMGSPDPLVSDDVLVRFNPGYEAQLAIRFLHDDPTPCTIVAMYPQVTTYEQR
ncbi:MAG: hypothetical protein AAFR28_06315 [Pseudomonadota bacterium]